MPTARPFVRRLSVSAIVWLAAPASACAQGGRTSVVANGTERLTIESRVLGEKRIVDVTVPIGYARDSAARYPLVVALDGEYEGEIAAALTRFYANVGMMPGVIVAAVHNTDRTRDLTPAAIPPFAAPPGSSGGADKFLSFLADELLPRVERSFHTAPMRVLVGHSLGGLFTLHALAKRPELFTGYIVMEPAAWWNNEGPTRDARAALQQPAARRARVMLVNAQSLSADTNSWGGNRPMVRHIRVSDESHSSMAAIGMATALRRLFEDYRAPRWQPGTAPVQMLVRYDSLAARVGYNVPIPEETFETVARMSLDSRRFDDAQRVLERMERTLGRSESSRQLRTRLASERNEPAPSGWIPLVIPANRPSAVQAARFIGRWRSEDASAPHEVEIRASGDTIVIHDHVTFPEGEPFDGDDPVVQLTSNGVLEWGLPFFNGLAALVVLKATLLDDDTMVAEREARGWVPRDPNYKPRVVVRFKRVRA
jgi:predicted alpha/beta superfamily hydrolase